MYLFNKEIALHARQHKETLAANAIKLFIEQL